MKITKWNTGWKFWADRDTFALVWNIPEHAVDVELPHDAMIEQNADEKSLNGGSTGYRSGENYTYVKTLHVKKEDAHKHFVLKFEGIYMNAMVYVNQQLAGKNMFGYTDFYIELDSFLNFGEDNEIRVQVRNKNMTNSRWYSGSGIYRDVYLLESELGFIKPNRIRICTETAAEELGVILVTADMENKSHLTKNWMVYTQITDADGVVVSEEKSKLSIFAGECRSLSQRMAVDCPKLWSEDLPYLYRCRLSLLEEGKEVDAWEESFGIRTLSLDVKRGLRINGKTVKLRGACIHHDSGLLGAATYDEAQFRQIKKMKEAGFNAIRMAHHPMAPAMLRACDALGIYVMDEAFDIWTRCKSDLDYGLYFDEWWERDITAMVEKDFNHPCVILYSIGNEIPEIGTAHGAKICADLTQKIKSLDSTRFVLASINGVFAAGDRMEKVVGDISENLRAQGKIEGNVNNFMALMDKHMDDIVMHEEITKKLESACAPVDIAGYNYMTARYIEDGKRYPNRVIVGSETNPPEIGRNWKIVQEYSHVIGDFTWTGWDYIGEAGVGIPGYSFGEGGFGAKFPCQLAYCGDFDLTGERRPASYFREIVFGLRKEPYIAVQKPQHYGKTLIKTPWMISDTISSWDHKGFEGKAVIVEVYADFGSSIQLLINGKSVGEPKKVDMDGYRFIFETVYEEGEIEAIACKEGREIGRMKLETPNREEAKLAIYKEELEGDLVYYSIDLVDEKGKRITGEEREIEVLADGAKILGLGSGDPKTGYSYQGSSTRTFEGHAQLILKKEQEEFTVDISEKKS